MNDSTKIPLRWLFAFLTCSGAAILLAVNVGAWIATLSQKADAASAEIVTIKSKIETLYSIDKRLSRIENALKIHPGQ